MKDPRGSYAYADMPRTGMGDMLFIWARAAIFAMLNDIPMLASHWTHFRRDALLAFNGHPRLYLRHFSNDGYISGLRRTMALRRLRQVAEPPVSRLPAVESATVYVFNQVPHWSDYFADIRQHRDFVRGALSSMVHPSRKLEAEAAEPPVIGVHVRRGEFRELRPGEDLGTVGAVRCPVEHFEARIRAIRSVAGAPLPATVFSDGRDSELGDLLAMEGVTRSPAHSDIADLLLLSRSKIIVAAPGSVFSLWAAFLSDAPAIFHRGHLPSFARPEDVRQRAFEGTPPDNPDDWPALLVDNIREI